MRAEPGQWEVLSLPAILKSPGGGERPLWEFKHRLDELHAIRRINPYVFDTQYMQNPTPARRSPVRQVQDIPEIPYTNRRIRKNYTDTADTGKDRLCSIDYLDTENRQLRP